MAYTLKVDGMAEISETLSKLEESAPAAAAHALYKGAGIVAKAIIKEMDSIQTAPFKYAKNGEKRLPSPEEKDVLLQAGVGIAKFDKDGLEMDTSVGFNSSGYANVNFGHMSSSARTNYKSGPMFKGRTVNASSTLRFAGVTEKGQNAKPIGVIANAINSGTSFMTKQPFVRKGANSGGKAAMAAMKEVIEAEFEAATKK